MNTKTIPQVLLGAMLVVALASCEPTSDGPDNTLSAKEEAFRCVRDQEASGSNPDTPTKIPVTTFVVTGIFFVSGFERPLKKHAGGMFLARGRIP